MTANAPSESMSPLEATLQRIDGMTAAVLVDGAEPTRSPDDVAEALRKADRRNGRL